MGWEPIDMTMPMTWHRFFGRQIGRSIIGCTLAFSWRTWALGFELVTRDAKGICLFCGPFLIAVATLTRKDQ